MYYIVETQKTFDQAVTDLDAAVRRHDFGVLHVHDLGATLRSKGLAFDRQCKIFEVCSPQQAAAVLASDMRLNMALPCRISVHTEGGTTFIGMIEPVALLGMLSQVAALKTTAHEVQEQTRRMIDEAG